MKTLIAKGLGWLAFSRGFLQIQNIIFSAILARLIVPNEFGILVMAATLSGFIALFSLQGFGSALVQKQDITEGHKSSLFWLNLVVGILSALAVVGFAPLIGKFYNNLDIVPVARLLGIILIISSVGLVHSALLTREMNFKLMSIADMASSFVANVNAIVLAFMGFGVWSLVWQVIIRESCHLLLLWWFYAWRPRFQFSFRCIREMLGFSAYLQASTFVTYANQNLDNILIGKFLGSMPLAHYDRAYQLMRLPQTQITYLFRTLFFPVFSTLQNDHAQIRKLFLRATQCIAFISIPIGVGLMVVAPEFITLLYGSRWERTIFLFQVLVLVGVIQSLAFMGVIYLSQGRTKLQLYMRIFAFFLLIPAFAIGVRWNIEGVAIGYAIASIVGMLPLQYFGFRLIGLHLGGFYRNLLPIVIPSGLMGGIVWLLRYYCVQNSVPDWITFFGCLIIGASIYLGLMKLIAPAVFQELIDSVSKICNLKNTQATLFPDSD